MSCFLKCLHKFHRIESCTQQLIDKLRYSINIPRVSMRLWRMCWIEHPTNGIKPDKSNQISQLFRNWIFTNEPIGQQWPLICVSFLVTVSGEFLTKSAHFHLLEHDSSSSNIRLYRSSNDPTSQPSTTKATEGYFNKVVFITISRRRSFHYCRASLVWLVAPRFQRNFQSKNGAMSTSIPVATMDEIECCELRNSFHYCDE